jgi:hypothetical protein
MFLDIQNEVKMKRVPMVTKMRARLKSNPNVNLVDMNMPLTNGLPTPKLKDILETEVDEKYYLKNETIEKIVKESQFQEKLVSFRKDK